MKLDRGKFVDDARALAKQGVAFRHQGCDPATGMDCVNLPRYLCGLQGIELPAELNNAMSTYSEEPDGQEMLRTIRKPYSYPASPSGVFQFIEIPVVDNRVPDAQPGDLIVCYVMRNPKHMAVIVELMLDAKDRQPWATVVEAWRAPTSKTGKLIDQPLDWRRRIAACFRIPDFA